MQSLAQAEELLAGITGLAQAKELLAGITGLAQAKEPGGLRMSSPKLRRMLSAALAYTCQMNVGLAFQLGLRSIVAAHKAA